MVSKEALAVTAAAGLAGFGVAELPNADAQAVKQPSAIEAVYSPKTPSFGDFLGAGPFDRRHAGEKHAEAAQATATPDGTFVQIQSARVSSSDIINKNIAITEDVHFPGKVDKLSCHWVKGFWNSGKDANGVLHWFWDPKRGELCRDKASPTGWVKMAGGITGRHCKNPATEIPKAPEKVLLLKKLSQKVTIHGLAEAKATESCGSAEAKAEVTQRINLKTLLRANKGTEVKIFERLHEKAVLKAEAEVTCETTTTPPTTTTTTTTTPPPSHGCSVSNILEKDGRTTNMTVTTDTNPSLETVAWGDGQSSSYGNTSSSQMETHFYNSDSTFTETVKLNFADGGSATCTGSITTQQETAPPPPAP